MFPYRQPSLLLLVIFSFLAACDPKDPDSPKATPKVPTEVVTFVPMEKLIQSEVKAGRPSGLAFDKAGMLYVTTYGTHQILKVTPSGQVSIFAGTGEIGYQDGDAAQAKFSWPTGLAFDAAGNLLVADSQNRCIRKITPAGQVSTFAGQPYVPYDSVAIHRDGQGTNARFCYPTDPVFDTAGNLYVVDAGYTFSKAFSGIRKITPSGQVSTLAGFLRPESPVNFTNTVELAYTRSVAIDSRNNLAVAGDWVIHKVSPTGQISLLKENSAQSSSSVMSPNAIVYDSERNLYFADMSSIRKMTPDGTITQLTSLSTGYRDGPIDQAEFFAGISDLLFDAAGNLYVAEEGYRIRKILFK